jgi:SAM-dependent methyltransferase
MNTTDVLLRFTDRVENYAKYRPTYPEEILDLLQRNIGVHSAHVVADIGSGTGISSELFLRNGNRVLGVEPNDAMRAAAEDALARYDGFHSVKGTAEATTLEDMSVDVIVAGQAFHWFDCQRAKREFERIAKPNAHLALMWNDRAAGSRFMLAYEEFVRRFATDYERVNHKNISDDVIRQFYQPAQMNKAVIQNQQTFDFEGLKGRNLSASYMPSEKHPTFGAMSEALWEMFELFQKDGVVRFDLETRLYWGMIAA